MRYAHVDALAVMGDKLPMDEIGPITDPSGVLYGFAAVSGLFASFYWFRIGRGELGKEPVWPDLRYAALTTAAALFFASIGRLI